VKDNVRDLWRDALMSGKYNQARGALRKDERFCVLGVLCEVYREETGKGVWYPESGGKMFFAANRETGAKLAKTEKSEHLHVLPDFVRTWAGLKTPDPFVNGSTISAHNDRGTGFKKLTKLIEHCQ